MQLRFKQLINGYANCPFPTPSVTQRMQGKKWPGCKLTENINKNKPHKANMWQPNRLCRLQQYYQKQYVCLSVCLKSNSIRAFLPPLKLYFMTISHWLVTGRMATLPCTQRPNWLDAGQHTPGCVPGPQVPTLTLWSIQCIEWEQLHNPWRRARQKVTMWQGARRGNRAKIDGPTVIYKWALPLHMPDRKSSRAV